MRTIIQTVHPYLIMLNSLFALLAASDFENGLQIAQNHIQAHQWEEARQALAPLEPLLDQQKPLHRFAFRFYYGQTLLELGQSDAALPLLEAALPKRNGDYATWTSSTTALLAKAYLQKGDKDSLKKAALIYAQADHPEEAAWLTHYADNSEAPPSPCPSLERQLSWLRLAQSPQSSDWQEALQLIEDEPFLRAVLLYKIGALQEAKELFASLKENPEALYWAAQLQEDPQEKSSLLQAVWQHFPSSSFADHAYFEQYTFAEYLQGSRQAHKHLEGFAKRFPSSALLPRVFYLQGLDALRDRRTAQGRYLQRKDLLQAIDHFHASETALLAQKNRTPDDEELLLHARLHRAWAHYEIAQQSSGAKQQIYWNYAEELFHALAQSGNLEGLYGLIQTQWALGKKEQALALAQNTPPISGYFPAKILALQALYTEDPSSAIALLTEAERRAEETLSHEELLTLWIHKQRLYRALGENALAMRLLSQIINYPAVSSIRLEAMWERAQLYKEDGKEILARKQLEALARKGGAFGQKAEQQLEQMYGFE